MTPPLPDDETTKQLADLGYLADGSGEVRNNSILICDVDEVVLHLVDPFITVLNEQGFDLRSHSFKLTGNVFNRETGAEASQKEVWAGLTQLFKEQSVRQGLVAGVVEALIGLSKKIDILFLTNLPHEFRQERELHLIANELNFPVITNTGSKVPAIDIIAQHHKGRVGFIDDTPQNLNQVREGLEDISLFHFMANDDFRALAGTIEGIEISTGDWPLASQTILQVLVENAART